MKPPDFCFAELKVVLTPPNSTEISGKKNQVDEGVDGYQIFFHILFSPPSPPFSQYLLFFFNCVFVNKKKPLFVLVEHFFFFLCSPFFFLFVSALHPPMNGEAFLHFQIFFLFFFLFCG